MSKFAIVVNDDGTATVTVNGEVMPDVTEVFFYGAPRDYSASVKQYARNEEGKFYIDETTCEIASNTKWFWFH